MSNTSGANINNLRFSQIADFKFILPPISKQKLIIAKLDSAFAGIDKVISYEKKLLDVKNLNNKIFNELLNQNKSKISFK